MEVFYQKHRQAKTRLWRWLSLVEAAQWRRFPDVRDVFGSADPYAKDNKNYIIFNIGGGKYRLIAAVNYQLQILEICFILTHDEYARSDWKKGL